MKTQRLCYIMVAYFVSILFCNNVKSQNIKYYTMVENIHWLGQAAVKIVAEGKTIYIDPYQIKVNDQADIILITHCHSDHLSPADIKKVISGNSILVMPDNCREKAGGIDVSDIKYTGPGKELNLDDITIKAVPAYNVVKSNFHPKSNNWVGYIVEIAGVKIYHAGDTERVPEMKDIDCDIALLPLGQKFTMNSVDEAANAAIDVKAEIAIPIHFGLYEGNNEDAEKFKELLQGKVDVIIKPSE